MLRHAEGVSDSCTVVSDSGSWQPHGLYNPWNSPKQNNVRGSPSLLQGIFPTQGSSPGLPPCRWILCHLSHKTKNTEVVAYPFSSRSSVHRNWTGVSCIAGRFFTNWAIREALRYTEPGSNVFLTIGLYCGPLDLILEQIWWSCTKIPICWYIFTCILATWVIKKFPGTIRYPIYLVLNLPLILQDFELILKNWWCWTFMKYKAGVLNFFDILVKALFSFCQPLKLALFWSLASSKTAKSTTIFNVYCITFPHTTPRSSLRHTVVSRQWRRYHKVVILPIK